MCLGYVSSYDFALFNFSSSSFCFTTGILKAPMRWSRWKVPLTILLLNLQLSFITKSVSAASSQSNQNFKISPKPCTVSGVTGTCMFVWECLKSEGTHIGMCMDGFMFGSCCGHNLTESFVLPPSTPFRPLYKPTAAIKQKPSKYPNRPNSYGTLTIERPNGSGTLVIRQPQKPPSSSKPSKPTKNPLDNFNDSANELNGSASVFASEF